MASVVPRLRLPAKGWLRRDGLFRDGFACRFPIRFLRVQLIQSLRGDRHQCGRLGNASASLGLFGDAAVERLVANRDRHVQQVMLAWCRMQQVLSCATSVIAQSPAEKRFATENILRDTPGVSVSKPSKRGGGERNPAGLTLALRWDVADPFQEWCTEHKLSQRDVIHGVMSWWMAQPEVIRRVCAVGRVDEGFEGAYADALEAMAAGIRSGGIKIEMPMPSPAGQIKPTTSANTRRPESQNRAAKKFPK